MDLNLILDICIISLLVLMILRIRNIIKLKRLRVVEEEYAKFKELISDLDIEIDSIEVGEGFTNRYAYLTDESRQQILKFFSETRLTKNEIKKYLLCKK